MASSKSIFLIGPGLIGWSVLDLLIGDGYSITGLVRRKEHGEGIKASGATPLYGDLDDSALITEQTASHDLTVHTATADHLASVLAVIEGLEQRAAKGLETVFIHTSGTSVLDDGSIGMFKSDKIYRDDCPEEIDALAYDAPHRPIDLAIVKAKKELGQKAKIAIMIPPLIYGTNHGRLTIQIPVMTRFALKHGYAPYVGAGAAVESNIHVLDLARAYQMLLKHLISVPNTDPSLANLYYFCETTGDNEPSWREVAETINEGLVKAGKLETGKVSEMVKEQWADAFGGWTPAVVGLNSRSRAIRLRELGWEPKEKGWQQSWLEDELPLLLKEETGDWKGYAVQF